MEQNTVTDIAENAVVDGRYRVLQRVGSGGMADVYCAEDTQLERKVALKVLYRRFAQDQEFVERFRREASAAAGLQHPNVVAVYDRGSYDDTYYIAMEYLDGRSLKQLIDDEAPLDPKRAVEITKQILQACRFAHQNGIVHRDLKPHNVIIDDDDRVKVTDFGIARAGASDMTETGSILGTAQYLAPEQAQGKEISAATDLYSVGVVLFEMLTGHVPFEGDSAVAIALKHVSEQPPSPRQYVPAVAPQLERTVLRALTKDPGARFQSADEFIAALDGAEIGEPPPSGPQSTAVFAALPAESAANGDRPLPPEARIVGGDQPAADDESADRRRRWWVWVAVLAVLAAVGIGAYFLLTPSQVSMPAVTGKPVEDARSQLEQVGLQADVKRVASNAAADTVLEQSPLVGTKVDKGSTVLLTVSSGPQTVAVPDVSGLDQTTARQRLKKAGFKTAAQRIASADVNAGEVIKTDPPAGENTAVGSTVTMILSSGPAQVALLSVVGQDRGTAMATLKDLGLNVDIEQVDSNKPKDQVLEQSPAAGTKVDKGSSVTLRISNGSGAATVPSVVGLSEAAATTKLQGRGLAVTVRTKTTRNLSQDGTVLKQSPGSGTSVAKGDSVTIVVGKFQPDVPPGTGTP